MKPNDDLEYLHITLEEDTMEKGGPVAERYSFWKGLQIESIFKTEEGVKYKDEL